MRAAQFIKGVAEAYQFKGSFPFDVDHMHGGRGINLPKAETKKYFTDKKQWQRAVDDINSSKYDDNSDYIGVTGRSTVEINGREWARWSDAQQKGYIELSSMSEQGVAEGSADTVMFEIDSENAYNHVMQQFGSVVEWNGDTMVAPRKYWGSIQELAYSAGGEATEVGNEQGVAEGNYDRDDYYNARQGREYGKDMTATGWGGDGSKTRRDDIFKGQSKRLPADPFARTSGAVPKSGTGRIHSNALPGEMDEANDQKIGGRYDADEFDDMVSRLKKLAGAGPMKTVWDPDRRVYRNMPTAQQPAQQPKKAPR